MDSATAISVLRRVLCHLLTGIWWKLHQKTDDKLGIAKAFNLPMADVIALLAVAGVGKMTAQGFRTKQSMIDSVCNTSKGCLQKGDIRRVPYIINVSSPPLFKSPAEQAKGLVRCPPRVKLPDDLFENNPEMMTLAQCCAAKAAARRKK